MAIPQEEERSARLESNPLGIDLDGVDFAEIAMTYGMPLLKGIGVLVVGLWIIKILSKYTRKYMEKSSLDDSISAFLVSIVSNLLKVLLLISVLGMLGVEMTSFIALLGAAGLAVGVALSGTLQNFAGGVMLLIFKPFKVGDRISAQGHTGVVKEIQVFVTTLITTDRKTILIPNGPLSNGDITNFHTEGMIRVDLSMGIGYGESAKEARAALMKVMIDHPLVLDNPEPFVGVEELGDSSVNLAVRPHCRPDDYWKVYFDINEQGKEALDAAGIEIPFPQLDIHKK